jgi:KUP system potassium uptake protein
LRQALEEKRGAAARGSLAPLALSALGVVFGDIGTSPLYALKAAFTSVPDQPAPAVALGTLSLILWTLILVTFVKYITFALRIDNDGEGGILALMSLLVGKSRNRPVVVSLGLVGAALIYGDGAITPAISVLSAVEGLRLAAPSLEPYVLPASVLILVALFAIQPRGTGWIGGTFGPIMASWFVVIGVLGIAGIVRHPEVLAALDPRWAFAYLGSGGATAFSVLGGVFLCVTGAEALYADMGHFGVRPIRFAWASIVFPSLVLNYAGQTALVLEGAPTSESLFFLLCPQQLLIALVLLATAATVIASQAIITGAFSMTRQAILLGFLPRLRITQTSAALFGQIYVGTVNWLLMIVTLGLTIGFGKSDNLAAAYGIAVSATMLMTSMLLFTGMREIWGWRLPAAAIVAGAFIIVDAGFFAANVQKIADGGYVPIVLAILVYGTMLIWRAGAQAVAMRLQESVVPISAFLTTLAEHGIPRVPGTAVFLTRTQRDAPPVMVWHLKHNRALHQFLFVLTATVEPVPWINDSERLEIEEIAPHFWRARASLGFMERPDMPALLRQACVHGCPLDLSDVTYYVGHETVVPGEDEEALPRWVEALFAFMQRNSLHVSDYFKLPRDAVVEVGREVAI